MKFQMLGDANHVGPVRLSDVYNSQVGDASTGIAASQKALYDAYNSLNSRFTVNKVKLSDYFTRSDTNWSVSGQIYTLYKICWLHAGFTTSGTGLANGSRLTPGTVASAYRPRTSMSIVVLAQEVISSYMTAWLDMWFSGGTMYFDNRSGKTVKQIAFDICYFIN